MAKPYLSIIIPTLNEEAHLDAALRSTGDEVEGVEVLVADGGSVDKTVSIARERNVNVIACNCGRARQMNAAAAVATGEILLFLHADTLLPPDYLAHVRRIMADSTVSAGAFALRFNAPRTSVKLVALAANLRSRWLGRPYGDQAIFMRRRTFESLQGYRDIPIMEDFDLITRLKRRGRIAIAPAQVTTSARRCEDRGVWRIVLSHQVLIAGWRCGISPVRLARVKR